MGGSVLNQIIKNQAPNSCLELPLDFFQRSRIAIDTSLWLYLHYSVIFSQAINQAKTLPLNFKKIETKLLKQLETNIFQWLGYSITPIFVFDGPPSEAKLEILKRKARKEQQLKDLDLDHFDPFTTELAANKVENLRTILKREVRLPKPLIKTVKNFINDLGLLTLEAKEEADLLIANLYYQGLVTAIYSKDVDFLSRGVNCQIIKIENGQGTGPIAKVRFLNLVLNELNLGFEAFQDLAILSGCDYNQKLQGIGPVKALKLIRTHQRLENLTSFDLTPLRYPICRQLFNQRIDVDVDSILTHSQWVFPNKIEDETISDDVILDAETSSQELAYLKVNYQQPYSFLLPYVNAGPIYCFEEN